ncbi:hypothetical protein IIA79_00190 [bacterium]|nr:hypothetical protein [bacterium]
MCEVAFHNLATLRPRQAYVMIKDVMEHPELISTHEKPIEPPMKYPYNERYLSLAQLRRNGTERRREIEKRIKEFIQRELREHWEAANPPGDLDFIAE